MLPPAPARFSTITVWSSWPFRPSASRRARASVGPPGGDGTTSVTGRLGYVSADAAKAAPLNAVHASMMHESIFFIFISIGGLPYRQDDEPTVVRHDVWWPLRLVQGVRQDGAAVLVLVDR